MSCSPSKRRMYRCFVPLEEGLWSPAVHSNCEHNEYAALALRTMAETPKDRKWAPDVLEQFKLLRKLARVVNVKRLELEEVVNGYSGAMRRKYEEARVSLEDEWLLDHDFKLSAFVKGEKFQPEKKISKPRIINPRSARYNLVLATYLKPLEHALWAKWKTRHGGTRVSGKGLNSDQRARLIQRKMGYVGDCTVFEVDGKAFEAHVTRQQLVLEQSVYRAAFEGDDELRGLLRHQLSLKGSTAAGFKYKRDGGRASGDFNTGLGNTLLMGSFVLVVMRRFNLKHRWEVLVDGDNALIFVDTREAADVATSFSAAMSDVCSHEMEVEKPTTVLEEVIFGQSQPILTQSGYRMVRDYRKVLSGAFCGYRYYNDPKFAPKLLREVAIAESAVNTGVPVLGPYFEEAARILKNFSPLKDPNFFLEGHLLGWKPRRSQVVTREARVSFQMGFGMLPDEQVRMEKRLIACLRLHLHDIVSKARWLDNIILDGHGRDAATDYGFVSSANLGAG